MRDLEEVGDLERLSRIFAEIWSAPDSMITPELLRALSHAGNYVAGAFSNGDLIGGIVGFLGIASRSCTGRGEFQRRERPSAHRVGSFAWRRALRSTLGTALDQGYFVDSFSRSGCYVLTRP